MRRRGVIVLAIVAAALAAIIVVEGRRRPAGEQPAARARLLPPFDRKAVRYITIHKYAANQAFSLLHVPSPSAPAPAPAWQVDIPGAPAADDTAVEDLLAAADLAESDRTVDLTPEAAGLHPAVAELALETPLGAIALQFGHADATGQRIYARSGPDGPIRVINRRVFELVDRPPDAFRDRRLFPVDPAAVTAIAWSDREGTRALGAKDGRWQNDRDEWVATDRVVDSLRRLLALRIDQFGAQTAEKPAGALPLAVTAGAARVAVDIGANGEIARGDERLHVPADALEEARRSLTAAAARDDRLVTQAADTIAGVELSDARARLALTRVRGEWTFTSPKVTYGADTRVVDDWLARLGAVRVATKAGPRARRLVVTGRYRESADVQAPPDVYALLAPDPLRFRDRAVLSFARFDVRRVTRDARGDDFTATTEDGGTSWTSHGRVADPVRLAGALAALSDLRAEEFVPAPPERAPAVRWAVFVQAPGETRPVGHLVEVVPRADACVARVDRDSAAARLAPATCRALLEDPRKPA